MEKSRTPGLYIKDQWFSDGQLVEEPHMHHYGEPPMHCVIYNIDRWPGKHCITAPWRDD